MSAVSEAPKVESVLVTYEKSTEARKSLPWEVVIEVLLEETGLPLVTLATSMGFVCAAFWRVKTS